MTDNETMVAILVSIVGAVVLAQWVNEALPPRGKRK